MSHFTNPAAVNFTPAHVVAEMMAGWRAGKFLVCPVDRAGLGHLKPKPTPKASLASRKDIKQAVVAAKACGLRVAAIELRPGGAVRIFSDLSAADIGDGLFESWDKAGKL
jgi:hypothetical protein